jgi:hypothetical protein
MAGTDKRIWISTEINFMIRAVGYALLDCKINKIVEGLQIP